MSTIKRGPRPQKFDVLDQQVIRDSRLSYRARGVLARLLSNEDGFSMDAKDLAREGKEGRKSILSALKELRAIGYVVTNRLQDKKGQWKTETIVFDTPQLVESEPNPPKSQNRTSVRRTPVRRMPESSTLTEQGVVKLKNNNSTHCCDEAITHITSPKAKLSPKDQQSALNLLSKIKPSAQIELVHEFTRQRASIKNPVGWFVKMIPVAQQGSLTSPDQKRACDHASHHAGKVDTLAASIAQGRQIWERLNVAERAQVADALEKQLAYGAPHSLPLKALRDHGIEHPDVARELYEFLTESPRHANHAATPSQIGFRPLS